MASRDAKIRRFKPSDDKVVRFVIGKSTMEQLAVANRRAYVHPLVVASWMLSSYAIISFMNLWPVEKDGFMGHLRPIPMMAASAVPIMFLIDWLNRPGFEQAAQDALRGPDMTDMLTYYSRHPASGLWICEFGDLFVGLIALDANSEIVTKNGKKQLNKFPTDAVIRHFYVDEVYRSSGIQEDLLSHALRIAFDAEPALKVVNTHDSQLIPYVGNCLRNASFSLGEITKKAGVFGWYIRKRSLSRDEWEKKNKFLDRSSLDLLHMALLSSFFNDSLSPQQPFVLIQSSVAQSGIPLLRKILTNNLKTRQNRILLFSLIYPPIDLLGDVSGENVRVFDWLESVPNYAHDWLDPRVKISTAVEEAPSCSVQIIIDSVDTLCSDVGSISETYKFLSDLLSLVRARPSPSSLILHATRPSQLLPLLVQPTFSSSLVQLIAHPVVLLTHLAKEYLTPPPPSTPKAKFWNAFLPLSERIHDVERLVYGTNSAGEGSGGVAEIVIEILVRGGEGRKRGIERELEGWSATAGPCDLTKLEDLKGVWTKKAIAESGPDPTQNISFNLNLTPSQQESRAQVPLPYAHEGNPSNKENNNIVAAIFYDPDSADDIDDDDPDEDLDI